MNYEKVLGEHKFPTYEELKTGLIRLIDEGKISREDAARLLPELRESEDERIRKAVVSLVYEMKGTYQSFAKVELDKMIAWLEKQKETPMPNSTELIEMWHKAKAILKEKDFRGDEWRLAQNAFMDGFARGTCVKFEKQKDQKPISSCDIVPYIDDKIAKLQDMWREEKVSFDWDDLKDMIEDVARHFAEWGAEHEKEELMKEAVGGEVKDFCFVREVNYSSAKIEFSTIPELKVGDKVRVIVCKKEDEK